MQRLILKIGCLLCCLFIAWASDEVQAAKSSAPHVSNRIKIERPEKPTPEAVQDQPEKTAETVQEDAAGKKPEKSEAADKAVEEKTDMAESQRAEDLRKKEQTDEMRKEAVDLMGEKEDLYARKGRLDPFTPFVRGPEAESSDAEEKQLQRRKPRTPLERVSLGQLRLTAIMETPEQRLAMVEESSGKGYVVKKGTYIGDQGGRITKVLAEAIVIEEKYQDVFGNVATREKQLKLQK